VLQIVDRLFDLSKLKLLPQDGTVGRRLSPNSATADSDAIFLPEVSNAEVYWKVCEICYFLGCASPATLGKHLWYNIQDVRELMLMSICGHFAQQPEFNRGIGFVVSAVETAVWNREMNEIIGLSKLPSGETALTKCVRVGDANDIWILVNVLGVSVVSSSGADKDLALSTLQMQLWTYLFSDTPDISAFAEKNAKKRRYTRRQDVLEREKGSRVYHNAFQRNFNELLEDRQKYHEKISIEKDARARRALLRSMRGGLSGFMSTDGGLSGGLGPQTGGDAEIKEELSCEQSNASVEMQVDDPDLENRSTSESESDDDSEDENLSSSEDGDGLANTTAIARDAAMPPSLAAETDISFDASQLPDLQSTDESIDVVDLNSLLPELDYRAPDPYLTQYGRIFSPSDIIITHCHNHGRQPPMNTLSSVKSLEARYKFGARLRSCNEPDFIRSSLSEDEVARMEDSDKNAGADSIANLGTAAITHSAVEKSFGWLSQAIMVDIDSMMPRIPSLAILYMCLILSGRFIGITSDCCIKCIDTFHGSNVAQRDTSIKDTLLEELSEGTKLRLKLIMDVTRTQEVAEMLSLFVPLAKSILTEMRMIQHPTYLHSRRADVLRSLLESLSDDTENHRKASRMLMALLNEIMRILEQNDFQLETALLTSQLRSRLLDVLSLGSDRCNFEEFVQSYLRFRVSPRGATPEVPNYFFQYCSKALVKEHQPAVVIGLIRIVIQLVKHVAPERRGECELDLLRLVIESTVGKPSSALSTIRLMDGDMIVQTATPLLQKLLDEAAFQFDPIGCRPVRSASQLFQVRSSWDFPLISQEFLKVESWDNINGFMINFSAAKFVLMVSILVPVLVDEPPIIPDEVAFMILRSIPVGYIDQFDDVLECLRSTNTSRLINYLLSNCSVEWLLTYFLSRICEYGASTCVALAVLREVNDRVNLKTLCSASVLEIVGRERIRSLEIFFSGIELIIRDSAYTEFLDNVVVAGSLTGTEDIVGVHNSPSLKLKLPSTGFRAARRITVPDDQDDVNLETIAAHVFDGDVEVAVESAVAWLKDLAAGQSKGKQCIVVASSLKQLLNFVWLKNVGQTSATNSLFQGIFRECYDLINERTILHLIFASGWNIPRPDISGNRVPGPPEFIHILEIFSCLLAVAEQGCLTVEEKCGLCRTALDCWHVEWNSVLSAESTLTFPIVIVTVQWLCLLQLFRQCARTELALRQFRSYGPCSDPLTASFLCTAPVFIERWNNCLYQLMPIYSNESDSVLDCALVRQLFLDSIKQFMEVVRTG
jgi:hypothetical protein